MKIQTNRKTFFYILNYSFLVSVLIFIFFVATGKAKLKNNKYAVVYAIVAYSLIFFSFLYFDEYLSKYHRHLYLGTYTFLEYFFFASIIWLLVRNPKIKRIIVIISALFLAFHIYYFATTEIKALDSIPIGIETILILSYIVYFFYEQFKVNTRQFIYSNFWFWITIGILIYLSCSFFFYIMANSVEYNSIKKYWFITYIFETFKNIFLAIGVTIYLNDSSSTDRHKTSNIPYLDMI